MGMYGFNVADSIFIDICIRASWEEGVEFDAAHLPAQKHYHKAN